MPSTATKIKVAHALASTLLRLGFRAQRRVRRGGVVFDVDIREGIDLSLFLFGSFQRHVIEMIRRFVAPEGVVVDVGANVGAITLPAAAYLQGGHIYAFEPTDFAFAKLQRNVELNPALSRRITLIRSFLAERVSPESVLVAYSSWPVAETGTAGRHPTHRGVAKQATCGQTTLDQFVAEQQLRVISLIKIDTDGHEFAVLSGAGECLRRYRPVVIFEACEYLMRPPRATFGDFEKLFARIGYAIFDGHRIQRLTEQDFAARCPVGGGLDLVALPSEWRPFTVGAAPPA
jgi:FkbM family methyltransferase